jgi:ribose/xylose/arabinose/galactoside ABC-type transport system permease subunit
LNETHYLLVYADDVNTVSEKQLLASEEGFCSMELFSLLFGWLVGWLDGWLVGCLVGCLVGWLVGWLLGWLVAWFGLVWLLG